MIQTIKRLKIFQTFSYIIATYICSITLTLFLKWVMNHKEERFPLTFLFFQSLMNTFISGFVCKSYNLFIQKRIFYWKLFRPLILVGILTGIDYGLSNTSFIFITVTLYTMIKSSIPLFVMIISFLFLILKPKIILIISILFISIGIGTAVGSTTEYSLIGIILVLSSSIISALRLVILQKVLQSNEFENVYDDINQERQLNEMIEMDDDDFDIFEKDYEIKQKIISKPSTFLVYFYIMMILSITILPFSILLEWKNIYISFVNYNLKDTTIIMSKFWFIIRMLGIIFYGGIIAFFLNVVEYLLVQTTSSLTLTIIGISKELMLITCGIIIFGDHFTLINGIGFSICIIGIVIYQFDRLFNLNKIQKSEEEKLLLEEDLSEDEVDIKKEEIEKQF
eukprot:gene4136-7446_t